MSSTPSPRPRSPHQTAPHDTASLAPGIFVTLWGSGGPTAHDPRGGTLRAVDAELPWLRAVRPDGVVVHSDAEGVARDGALAAARLRGAVPGLRLWFGVGCDGAENRAHGDPARETLELGRFDQVRRVAIAVGAEAVDLDPEVAFKKDGTADDLFAGKLLEHAACPERYVLGFTSYDQPTLHWDFCWPAFLGPQVPVRVRPRFTAAQCYPAGAGYTVSRGMLQARIDASIASFQDAARKHAIVADVPDDQPGGDVDVDWILYLQAWGHEPGALVEQAVQWPLVIFWAAGAKIDEAGRQAIQAALAIRREVGWGADALARWQAAHGLAADGVCGPKTLAAALGASS